MKRLETPSSPAIPATVAKAEALAASLPAYGNGFFDDIAYLLAQLTSANKDEREQAKRQVRELANVGREILQHEHIAQNLATFANRHEP